MNREKNTPRKHQIAGIGLVFCFILILVVSACGDTPTDGSQSPSLETTITQTPTQHSTATKTPSMLSPESIAPREIGAVGNGLLGDVFYSDDGKMLAYVEGEQFFWADVATGNVLGSIESDEYATTFSDVVFSPKNQWIVFDSIHAELINTETGETAAYCESWDCGKRQSDFRFSSDNRYLGFITDNSSTGGAYDALGIYDIENGSTIFPDIYTGHVYHGVGEPAFNPDNTMVAVCYSTSNTYTLKVIDLPSGDLRYQIQVPSFTNSIDFSPDGQIMATGSSDGLIRLYRPSTGEKIRSLNGFQERIQRIRFSEDGSKITVSFFHHPDWIYDINTDQVEIVEEPPESPSANLFVLAKYDQGWADGSNVLFSPIDNVIAIGGENIQVWDIANKSVIASLKNPYSWIVGWAFSPQGDQIAGVTRDGDVLIWDIASESLIFELDSDTLLELRKMYAANAGYSQASIEADAYIGRGIAYSPDGAQIVFGNGNAVEIWDIASGKVVISMLQSDENNYTTEVSFSADGTRVYTITNRYEGAQVWDAQTGEMIDQLDLPSPDSSAYSQTALSQHYYARNNYDEENGQYGVELWDIETGEMQFLPIPGRGMDQFEISPDGSLIFGISDRKLQIWETASGNLVSKVSLEESANSVSMSWDNAMFAYGYYGVAHLWDTSTLAESVALQNYISPTPEPTETPWASSFEIESTATPSGNMAALLGEASQLPENAVSPDNIRQLAEMNRFGDGVVEDVLWMPGGSEILTARSMGIYSYSKNSSGTISVDLEPWMETVSLSADGDIVAAGVIGDMVQVWNVSQGQMIVELAGKTPVELSPNGQILAYGLEDDYEEVLIVFDLETKSEIFSIDCLYICNLPVFHPNNHMLALVDGREYQLGVKQYAQIWDIQTGSIYNSIGGLHGKITDLSFSADGTYLIGAEGGSAWVGEVELDGLVSTITLYDPEFDYNLRLYEQTISAVALSPNKEILAIGDTDGTIWFYSWRNGSLIRSLERQAASIEYLSFSPDGSKLLYIDEDGIMVALNNLYGTSRRLISNLPENIYGLKYSLDDDLIAWGQKTIWNVEPSSGEFLNSVTITDGEIFDVSASNEWIAVSHLWDISVYSTETGGIEQKLAEEPDRDLFVEYYWEGIILPGFYKASFSPDANTLTTGAPGEIWVYQRDEEQVFRLEEYIHNFPYYEILDEWEQHETSSKDGRFSAIAWQRWEDYPALKLYGPDENLLADMDFPEGAFITALAFSADARLIAVGFDDGNLIFVDVEKWQIVHQIAAHKNGVTGLVFSNDGIYLTSTGEDGTIKFWGIPQ